jgi:hypothetical protein
MCPDPLKCAVDSKCRFACLGDLDCVSGQKCVSFVCADPDELDPITKDIEHSNPNGYGATDAGGTQPDASVGTPDSGSGADTSVSMPEASTSTDATTEAEAAACPVGKGTCDGDPTPCTQNIFQVTQCGDCKTSCDGTHATSISCPAGVCVVASCNAGWGDCDSKPQTGCETNITNDSNNCGACKRVCAMTTCKAGTLPSDPSLCVPKELTTLGGGFRAIVASGSLYLTRVNAIPPSSFNIARIAVDGSVAAYDIASDTHAPGDLIAVGTDLWYAVGGNPPSVFKKALTAMGGDAPILVFQPLELPVYMSLRGNSLYWIAYSGGSLVDLDIFARSTTTGMADAGSKVATGTGGVAHFGTTSDAFYWLGNDGKMYSAPIGGGVGTEISGAGTMQGNTMTTDDTYVYFTQTKGAGTDGVYRYKTGGTVEPLVYKAGVAAILADTTNLYLQVGVSTVDIFKSPKAVSTGTPIASAFGLGYLVGYDATFLYTSQGATTSGSAWRIVK